MSETMSRKDFLKLTGAGLLGLILVAKAAPLKAEAASPTVNRSNGIVSDNLNNDAIFRSATPPANNKLLWHYTGTRNYTANLAPGYDYIAPGTLCYYDNGWKAVTATWA